MKATKRMGGLAATAVSAVLLGACAGPANNPDLARQCERGLSAAYTELDYAKTTGFDGTVDWTKAASLLSAASIQKEFGKYPNCVDKVARARFYIQQSQK
jgi:hypothetical protein